MGTQIALIKHNKPLQPGMFIYRASDKVIATPQQVLQEIVSITEINYRDIMGQSRKLDIVKARFLACYFLYDWCGLTFKKIAQFLRYDNHTSIMHARTYIIEQCEINNKHVKASVFRIEERLQQKYVKVQREDEHISKIQLKQL